MLDNEAVLQHSALCTVRHIQITYNLPNEGWERKLIEIQQKTGLLHPPVTPLPIYMYSFTFSHLADAPIQSDPMTN